MRIERFEVAPIWDEKELFGLDGSTIQDIVPLTAGELEANGQAEAMCWNYRKTWQPTSFYKPWNWLLRVQKRLNQGYVWSDSWEPITWNQGFVVLVPWKPTTNLVWVPKWLE